MNILLVHIIFQKPKSTLIYWLFFLKTYFFNCLSLVCYVYVPNNWSVKGAISLKLKSSFSCTRYTSLGANLPPKSFSEMTPRSFHNITMVCALDLWFTRSNDFPTEYWQCPFLVLSAPQCQHLPVEYIRFDHCIISNKIQPFFPVPWGHLCDFVKLFTTISF